MGTALVGLLVGIVVGLTSMGGGALLTPALIFLGVPASTAIGSDVLIASVTKFFGSGAYVLKREIHWRTVGALALGSIPGAFVGNRVLNTIPRASVDAFVVYGLGFVLLLAGSATLYRLRIKALPASHPMPGVPTIALMGFATGFIVMITSVGSGSLLMVLMLRFVPLPTRRLVGTDIVHALILSTLATILHARSGRVDPALAMSVLVGAIPGVLLGARMAGVLSEKVLRGAVAGILVFVGLVLVGRGPAHHPAPPMAAVGTMVTPVLAAEIHQ